MSGTTTPFSIINDLALDHSDYYTHARSDGLTAGCDLTADCVVLAMDRCVAHRDLAAGCFVLHWHRRDVAGIVKIKLKQLISCQRNQAHHSSQSIHRSS